MNESRINTYKVMCELTNWKARFTNGDGKIWHFPAAMYSEQVYYESNGDYHICLVRTLRRKKLIFCILASPEKKYDALNDFIRLSGISITDVMFSEIENKEAYMLLKAAKDRGFGIYENRIFDRFNIDYDFPLHNFKSESN